MIAIYIEIDGQLSELELPLNFSVSIQATADNEKESIAQKDFSYPVDIPLTDHNKQIFGFINRLDVDISDKEYDGSLFFEGLLVFACKVSIISISQQVIRLNLYRTKIRTEQKLQTDITKIPLGGEREIIGTGPGQSPCMAEHADELMYANADTADYVFIPTLNKSFYDIPSIINPANSFYQYPWRGYCGVVNAFDYERGKFWQPPSADQILTIGTSLFDSAQDPFPTVSTFVPYPYVLAIIKYIASYLGVMVRGSFYDDPDAKNLVIYNYFALDGIREVESAYSPGQKFYVNWCDTTINLANHLPQITISQFLDRLKAMFCLEISLDERYLVLDMPNSAMLESEITPIHDPNSVEKRININNTKLAFELLVDEDDGYSDIYKQTMARITNTNVLDDVVDTTSMAGDDDGVVRFTITSQTDYRKTGSSYTKTDITASPYYYPYGEYTENTQKIEMGIIAIRGDYSYTYWKTDPAIALSTVELNYDVNVILATNQKGTSKVYGQQGADLKLRIAKYIGTQTHTQTGNAAPFGSNGVYYEGSVVANWSLKWRGGEYGLWNKFFQNKYKGFQEVVTLSLMCDIHQLDDTLNTICRIQNRLLKPQKLEYTLNHSGVSDIKLTALLPKI